MARNNAVDKNSPEYLRKQIAGGQYSLMLILIFTAINIAFLMLDVDRYFLFSASVPYYLVMIGKGVENGFSSGAWDINGPLTITGLVIALVILAVYLLCWLLSRKKTGWMTAAMVLFIVDSIALVGITFVLYEDPMVNAMDFLLHIWAIVELVQAVRANKKLQAMQQEATRSFYTGPELQ